MQPSEQPSETPSTQISEDESSTEEIVYPEAKSYPVVFNYATSEQLTVWTDYNIDASVAPYAENLSQTTKAEGRRTVPYATIGPNDCPTYFLSVDADGFIVYGSCGLGVGFGGPHDDYYYNTASKTTNSDFWAVHEQWQGWSPELAASGVMVEVNGVQYRPWSVYDFLIPQGGFVIRGDANETNFQKLWNQLTGEIRPAKGYSATLNLRTHSTLDQFYLSLDEDHQLVVRERREDEYKDEDGDMIRETPSKNFTPAASDALINYTLIADAKELGAGQEVSLVKGVISYVDANFAIIYDEADDAIVVKKADLEFKVGDTVSVDGALASENGSLVINATKVEKTYPYYYQNAVRVAELTSENVAAKWVADSNLGSFRLVRAAVKSAEAGVVVVTLGETDISLKGTLPANISVGDTVDVLCSMVAENETLYGVVASSDNFFRYYNVKVEDKDGEVSTRGYATGEKVVLDAQAKDNYTFVKWVAVTKGENEEEVLTDLSTEVSVEITVGTEDLYYRPIYAYSAWASLPGEYGRALELSSPNKNADSSLTVWTDTASIVAGSNTSGNDKWIANGWRTFFIVDGNGKIALFSYNAAYCGLNPNSDWFARHSDYAQVKNNPAFDITYDVDGETMTDWTFAIPEGGFAVSMHTNFISEVCAAMGQAAPGYAKNSELNVDDVRAYYDAAADKIYFYLPSLEEDNYLVSLNVNGYQSESGIGLFTDDESNKLAASTEGRHLFDNANGWRWAVAVNAEGKIIYASWGLGAGYGSPCDDFYTCAGEDAVAKGNKAAAGQILGDFFALGEDYAAWGEWNADHSVGNYSSYEALVPTGGFVLTSHNSEANMLRFMTEVFGGKIANNAESINSIAAGTFDDVVIRLVEVNGVKQLKVENGHGWTELHMPSTEELFSLTGYDVAVQGVGAGTVYNQIFAQDANKIYVSVGSAEEAYIKPNGTFVIDDSGIVHAAQLNAMEGAQFNLTVEGLDYNKDEYYTIITWKIADKDYKVIAYHAANSDAGLMVTNAALIEQVGKSVKIGNSANVDFTWNGYKGVYEAELTIGAWKNITLTYTADDDSTVMMKRGGAATIEGLVQTSGIDNAYDNGGNRLFISSEANLEAGNWMTPDGGTRTWKFTYNPTTNTFTVAL